MQLISAADPASRSARFVLARAAASALLMLVAGGLLGWLVVGTPIISSLMPSGRPTPLQIAVGIFAWGFAIVVPAGFLLLGTVRMFGVVERATARPRTMGTRLAKQLGADHVAVTNLVVPGGRRVHELLLGPYGVVVLAEVPPPTVSRHVGSRWEVRGARGRWIAIEAPVDRAMRDAEQVRSWLAAEDEYDFVVRVYAAVVTDDARVERIPGCAVVPPDALAGWLEALPPQRGLTADRREHVIELLREVMGA